MSLEHKFSTRTKLTCGSLIGGLALGACGGALYLAGRFSRIEPRPTSSTGPQVFTPSCFCVEASSTLTATRPARKTPRSTSTAVVPTETRLLLPTDTPRPPESTSTPIAPTEVPPTQTQVVEATVTDVPPQTAITP